MSTQARGESGPMDANEPTDKRIAILHRSDSYGPIRIYGPLQGEIDCVGDTVTIAGHTLTEAELRRGWFDPNA